MKKSHSRFISTKTPIQQRVVPAPVGLIRRTALNIPFLFTYLCFLLSRHTLPSNIPLPECETGKHHKSPAVSLEDWNNLFALCGTSSDIVLDWTLLKSDSSWTECLRPYFIFFWCMLLITIGKQWRASVPCMLHTNSVSAQWSRADPESPFPGLPPGLLRCVLLMRRPSHTTQTGISRSELNGTL